MAIGICRVNRFGLIRCIQQFNVYTALLNGLKKVCRRFVDLIAGFNSVQEFSKWFPESF